MHGAARKQGLQNGTVRGGHAAVPALFKLGDNKVVGLLAHPAYEGNNVIGLHGGNLFDIELMSSLS